jgi:hypothetical protein
MFKDLFLAIVLGALLGFGVTGGYYTINKAKTNTVLTPTATPTPEIIVTPPPTGGPTETKKEISLTISKPLDNTLVNTSKITITGNSTPKAQIIINTPITAYNTQADDSGNFSLAVSLEAGVNEIKISSFDKDDNQTDIDLTVTYSTAQISFLSKIIKPVFAQESDEIQNLREKFKEQAKVSLATDNKKAFWGTITQIDGRQITIKKDDLTYKLDVTDDAAIVNEKKIKIKLETLKVNQIILAMGTYDPATDTLITSRIVPADPKTIIKNYQVISGTIADISQEASIITIIPIKNKDLQYQVTTDNKDLKIGDKIIASLLPDPKNSKSFIAVKIFARAQ